MAGDVKIKIGADTSELEKEFSTLIKRIQSDSDKLKLGGAPGGAAQTDREGARNKSFVDAQAKQYANIVKSLKEEYALLQQIGREREKQSRQEHLANIQKTTFTQIQRNQGWAMRGTPPASGGMPPSGGPPNIPPPPSNGTAKDPFGKGGVTSLSGLASALGVPALAIGGVATAIAGMMAGEGIRKFYAQAENRARVVGSEAFNTQGQAGQLLSSSFSGGAGENILFSSQRQQAAGIAYQTQTQNVNSFIRGLTHPQEVLNYIGLGTDATNRESAEKRNREMAQIQSEQEDALRNGPGGKIGTEVTNKFLKDWRRNLDFQRQTGLGEGGFRDYLGGVNRAGFGDEQGMGASSAILGAGGSTRASTGSAAFALQMGRQFDLTNASQSIGAISGQLGGSQQSKDALIAIQAEGTRLGLNKSDMREENRKFVEMASNVISQSNVSSGAGVDQVLQMLSRSMSGATTTAGLQAGQSAYQAYQNQSNIQSGPSAVMRSAGMRGDSILGQLNERDRAKLSMMPESEITTDSNEIQAMAAKSGLKASDIVKNYHGVIANSLFVNKTTDTAISRLKAAQFNNGYGPQVPNLSALEGEAAGEIRLEGAGAGMTNKQLTQYARMQAAGDSTGMAKLREDLSKQAGSATGGRPGDEMERQQAEAARMANELFVSIQKSIGPAAEVTAQFTTNINALMLAMKGGDQSAISNALRNMYNFGSQQKPQDQDHAGSGGPPTTSMGSHF